MKRKRLDNLNEAEIKKAQKRKLANLFLWSFVLLVIIFSGIGALIINDSGYVIEKDQPVYEEDEFKGRVDNRLKFIEMQDSDKVSDNSTEDATTKEESGENSEKQGEFGYYYNSDFQAPSTENSAFKKKDGDETEEIEEEKSVSKDLYGEDIPSVNKPKPLNADGSSYSAGRAKPVNVIPKAETIKIIVGSYKTREEAVEAIGQLNGVISGSPMIRVINDRFVLQVASYKNVTTAAEYANNLQNKGYYVRIIKE